MRKPRTPDEMAVAHLAQQAALLAEAEQGRQVDERRLQRIAWQEEQKRQRQRKVSEKEFVDKTVRSLQTDVHLIKQSLAAIHAVAQKEADGTTD
jgi:hypothetical protein